MSSTIQLWRKASLTYNDQPAAPAAPVASNITQTGVTMTWTPVEDADWYRLERSPAGAGTWVLNHQGSGLTKDVTGLTASTSYDFRLAAFAGGASGVQSEWSATTNMTTAGASAPPATPGAPAASNVSETTATLTVTAVATATLYGWQRSATSGTTGFATITGTGLTIDDSGLTASTNYWYKVRASNADGDSSYSTATAITTDAPPLLPPAKPAKLVLASQTPTSNTLQLTAVATATSYQVQRSATAPGAAPWANVYIGPNLTVSDTGRTPGATYYYRHSASNAAGEGPQSDTLTVSQPTSNPNVQPFSALQLRTMSGIAIHAVPTPWVEYLNVDAVFDAIERAGVTWIRGLAVPGNSLSDQYAAQCVARGLKWCMGVVGTSTSPTTTTAANKVRDIAEHPDYSVACLALEGLNEPNDNAPVPAVYGGDWADWTVDIQKTIYETAQEYPTFAAGIEFVGTALHQLRVKESNGAHYQMVVDRGIKNWTDSAGLHAYPNGLKPLNNMDSRIAYVRNAYGAGYPIRMTEFGYTTTSGTASGNTTTKPAMGIYGPRAYLQLCIGKGIPMSWYELLDDVDATGNDIQSHYGMVNTPSTNPTTWSDKPVIASVGQLLNGLAEPAGTTAYTPSQVVASVTSGTNDVAWFAVATKAESNAGTGRVYVFRDVNVANGVTNLTVLPVNVTIVDRVGSRTFQVDANVQRVNLR